MGDVVEFQAAITQVPNGPLLPRVFRLPPETKGDRKTRLLQRWLTALDGWTFGLKPFPGRRFRIDQEGSFYGQGPVVGVRLIVLEDRDEGPRPFTKISPPDLLTKCKDWRHQ